MLGDTHLGIYNDSEVWHDVTKSLFKEVCDYCIRNDIDTVVHGGDFFHNRKSTNTKTLDVALEISKILEGLNVFLIVGNHDTFFKNKIKPNSVEIFREHKHISIIDEPTKMEDILLVPWNSDFSDIESEFCFGHFEISGFKMNDNYTCEKGMSSSLFSKFKSVYSSHFHTPSRSKNITYLGAPFQQTFNDLDGKRGYYIFDNGEITFIEFTNYPHFIKHNAGEKIKKHEVDGNVIRLMFLKDFGEAKNQSIVDDVISKNPLQLHVDFKMAKSDDNEIEQNKDIGIIDHDEVIKNYIDNYEIPEHISKKILTKMILKFKKGAYEP